MGHGTVADEIKGRAAQFVGERSGAILAIEEEGVRFRSYLDGSTQVHGPGDLDGGPGRAAARTSRWCSTSARRSTPTASTPRARPSARTAGWTAASTGTPQHGPEGQTVYGIVQGGVEEDLRRASAQEVAARDGARRHRDRRLARRGQGADVRGRRVDDRGAAGGQAAPPARDRRGRRPRARRRARHRHLRLRDADPDRPPRHGARARPGQALARRPGQGALEAGRRAAARGLPVPGLRARATRAPTSTTCSRPRSRPRCACSRSTTSPTSSA